MKFHEGKYGLWYATHANLFVMGRSEDQVRDRFQIANMGQIPEEHQYFLHASTGIIILVPDPAENTITDNQRDENFTLFQQHWLRIMPAEGRA